MNPLHQSSNRLPGPLRAGGRGLILRRLRRTEMDEMLEAERLAEALEGTVVTHEVTRGLASMAHELGGTLRQPLLDPHDRAHIHAAMMRLVESGAPAIRPATWHRVPVTRRQGAVLGGVAAASLVAAIGYAVMHERHKTRRAVAAA